MTSDIGAWAPKEFPTRPVTLTWTDTEIVEHMKAARRGKVGADDHTQLQRFGTWRAAVWEIECGAVGQLNVLFTVIDMLDAREQHEHAEEIREFVHRWHNGCTVPNPVPGMGWRRTTAEFYSQNRKLLPLHLRIMTTPPAAPGEPAPAVPLSFDFAGGGGDVR